MWYAAILSTNAMLYIGILDLNFHFDVLYIEELMHQNTK